MSLNTEPARDWNAVAQAWDENIDDVDKQSAPATEALFDCLDVQPGERLLELAAGPGALGADWSRLVGAEGTVTLSDIAPGMVELAARRNATLDNVTVAVLDASAIDRPNEAFDVVASRMGLMFAPDPSMALAEIHRVLATGGRIGALTWAALEHNPWLSCVGMSAMMHGLVAGGPPVGPGGVFSLGDPVELAQLVERAGFVDVHVEAIDITFRTHDIESHVDRVSSLAGPLATVLREATADQRAAVRQTAADLTTQYVTDDGLAIPGRALLAFARR